MDDDGAFSFQTGPGRIRLGAFVSADGAGVSAARVDEEKVVEAPPVSLRVLRSPRRIPNLSGYADRGLYIDPEQTASRTRTWDDAA